MSEVESAEQDEKEWCEYCGDYHIGDHLLSPEIIEQERRRVDRKQTRLAWIVFLTSAAMIAYFLHRAL